MDFYRYLRWSRCDSGVVSLPRHFTDVRGTSALHLHIWPLQQTHYLLPRATFYHADSTIPNRFVKLSGYIICNSKPPIPWQNVFFTVQSEFYMSTNGWWQGTYYFPPSYPHRPTGVLTIFGICVCLLCFCHSLTFFDTALFYFVIHCFAYNTGWLSRGLFYMNCVFFYLFFIIMACG